MKFPNVRILLMKFFEKKTPVIYKSKEQKEMASVLKDMVSAYTHRTGIKFDGYPEGEDKAEYDALNEKIRAFESNSEFLQKMQSYVDSFPEEEKGWGSMSDLQYMRKILKELKN